VIILYDERNVTRAAARLFITQSAVQSCARAAQRGDGRSHVHLPNSLRLAGDRARVPACANADCAWRWAEIRSAASQRRIRPAKTASDSSLRLVPNLQADTSQLIALGEICDGSLPISNFSVTLLRHRPAAGRLSHRRVDKVPPPPIRSCSFTIESVGQSAPIILSLNKPFDNADFLAAGLAIGLARAIDKIA